MLQRGYLRSLRLAEGTEADLCSIWKALADNSSLKSFRFSGKAKFQGDETETVLAMLEKNNSLKMPFPWMHWIQPELVTLF